MEKNACKGRTSPFSVDFKVLIEMKFYNIQILGGNFFNDF